MRNDRILAFQQGLLSIVGKRRILTNKKKIQFYSSGIRVGNGDALMVIFPKNLLELWKILEICINFDNNQHYVF